MSETEAGHKRGFGFAGKLFPTMNPQERVETANFFSVDVLMGTKLTHFVDSAFTNEPDTGFDLFSILLGLKILKTLKLADQNPGFRPLYPVSELGTSPSTARTPHWMRVRPEAGAPRVNQKDFRNELNIGRYFPNGLRLTIAVSDTTKDTSSEAGWKEIGFIQLKESSVSYGCDRQLHFAHPKLR